MTTSKLEICAKVKRELEKRILCNSIKDQTPFATELILVQLECLAQDLLQLVSNPQPISNSPLYDLAPFNSNTAERTGEYDIVLHIQKGRIENLSFNSTLIFPFLFIVAKLMFINSRKKIENIEFPSRRENDEEDINLVISEESPSQQCVQILTFRRTRGVQETKFRLECILLEIKNRFALQIPPFTTETQRVEAIASQLTTKINQYITETIPPIINEKIHLENQLKEIFLEASSHQSFKEKFSTFLTKFIDDLQRETSEDEENYWRYITNFYSHFISTTYHKTTFHSKISAMILTKCTHSPHIKIHNQSNDDENIQQSRGGLLINHKYPIYYDTITITLLILEYYDDDEMIEALMTVMRSEMNILLEKFQCAKREQRSEIEIEELEYNILSFLVDIREIENGEDVILSIPERSDKPESILTLARDIKHHFQAFQDIISDSEQSHFSPEYKGMLSKHLCNDDYNDETKEYNHNGDDQKKAMIAEESKKGTANTFFRNKQYLQAIEHYTELLKEYPNDPSLFLNRSFCYLLLQKYEESIYDANTFLLKSWIYTSQNNIQKNDNNNNTSDQHSEEDKRRLFLIVKCYYRMCLAYKGMGQLGASSIMVQYCNHFDKFNVIGWYEKEGIEMRRVLNSQLSNFRNSSSADYNGSNSEVNELNELLQSALQHPSFCRSSAFSLLSQDWCQKYTLGSTLKPPSSSNDNDDDDDDKQSPHSLQAMNEKYQTTLSHIKSYPMFEPLGSLHFNRKGDDDHHHQRIFLGSKLSIFIFDMLRDIVTSVCNKSEVNHESHPSRRFFRSTLNSSSAMNEDDYLSTLHTHMIELHMSGGDRECIARFVLLLIILNQSNMTNDSSNIRDHDQTTLKHLFLCLCFHRTISIHQHRTLQAILLNLINLSDINQFTTKFPFLNLHSSRSNFLHSSNASSSSFLLEIQQIWRAWYRSPSPSSHRIPSPPPPITTNVHKKSRRRRLDEHDKRSSSSQSEIGYFSEFGFFPSSLPFLSSSFDQFYIPNPTLADAVTYEMKRHHEVEEYLKLNYRENFYSHLSDEFDRMIEFIAFSTSSHTYDSSLNESNFPFLFFQTQIHLWDGDLFYLPSLLYTSTLNDQTRTTDDHPISEVRNCGDDDNNKGGGDGDVENEKNGVEEEGGCMRDRWMIDQSNRIMSRYRFFDYIYIDHFLSEEFGLLSILPTFLPLLKSSSSSSLNIEVYYQLNEKNTKSEKMMLNSLFSGRLLSSEIIQLFSLSSVSASHTKKNSLVLSFSPSPFHSSYSWNYTTTINNDIHDDSSGGGDNINNDNEDERRRKITSGAAQRKTWKDVMNDLVNFFDYGLFGEREDVFLQMTIRKHAIITTYSFLPFFSYLSHNHPQLAIYTIEKIMQEMQRSNAIYKVSFTSMLFNLLNLPSVSISFKKMFEEQVSLPFSSLKMFYAKFKWKNEFPKPNSSYLLLCGMYIDINVVNNLHGADMLNWINNMDGNHLQIIDCFSINYELGVLSFAFPEFLMEDGDGERPSFLLLDITTYELASFPNLNVLSAFF